MSYKGFRKMMDTTDNRSVYNKAHYQVKNWGLCYICIGRHPKNALYAACDFWWGGAYKRMRKGGISKRKGMRGRQDYKNWKNYRKHQW